MEKIALNTPHEVELYANTELEEFTAQLFLHTNDVSFCFDLEKEKTQENTFIFKIPDELKSFLKSPVDYEIYVYLDHCRFKADSGKLQVISKDHFKGANINGVEHEDIKFKTKIKSSDDKPEEPKQSKEKPKKPPEPTSAPAPTKKPEPTKATPKKEENKTVKESVPDAKPAPATTAGRNSLRGELERAARQRELKARSDEINERVKKILNDSM